MKHLLFVFIAIIAFSCKSSNSSPTGPKIGQEFDLKYGESIQIQNESLTLKFENVADDSRCPTGASCVWAGNAKIILRVAQIDTSLNSALNPNEINYNSFNIKLLSVSPYPTIGQQIKLEDYIIRLIVTK